MLGYGCDVSQYPQFYHQRLEKYQLLPRPYLGSFEGGNGEKLLEKMSVRLGNEADFFSETIFKERQQINIGLCWKKYLQ